MNNQNIFAAKKKHIIIAFLVCWSLWLALEFFIFGKNSFVRVHDCAESNLSFRMTTSLISYEYQYPSWVPHFACGIDPLIMNNINFLTYDYFLFTFFSPWAVYIIIMILQRLLGTLFTYLLCKRIYRLPEIISIMAAMCFSLGTWSINDWTLFDQLGPPLIPMYLYVIEKTCMQKSYYKYLYCALIGLLISYFTFFPLFTPFFLLGAFVWLVIIRKHEIKNLILCFFFIVFFSTLLELPQLMAIFSNLSNSGRFEATTKSITLYRALDISFKHLLTLFFRYKLITIIALICFFSYKFKNKQLNLYFYTITGLVLFSKGCWILSVTNRENLRFLSALNFNDFLIMYPFMLIIFMAQSLNHLNRYSFIIEIEYEN